MEARIAKLEAHAEHLDTWMADIRADLHRVRDDIVAIRTTDFRIVFGALIAVALGLSGLMARGFHWL